MCRKLFLFLLIFIPVQLWSQRILVLEKIGTTQRERYYVGDEITFRAGPQNVLFEGQILEIQDSSFVVGGNRFKPEDVQVFLYPAFRKTFRTIGKSALTGAFTMFTIAGLDRWINQKVKPVYDKPTLNLVSVFAGFGVLNFLVPEKKKQLKGKRRLRIINVTPG